MADEGFDIALQKVTALANAGLFDPAEINISDALHQISPTTLNSFAPANPNRQFRWSLYHLFAAFPRPSNFHPVFYPLQMNKLYQDVKTVFSSLAAGLAVEYVNPEYQPTGEFSVTLKTPAIESRIHTTFPSEGYAQSAAFLQSHFWQKGQALVNICCASGMGFLVVLKNIEPKNLALIQDNLIIDYRFEFFDLNDPAKRTLLQDACDHKKGFILIKSNSIYYNKLTKKLNLLDGDENLSSLGSASSLFTGPTDHLPDDYLKHLAQKLQESYPDLNPKYKFIKLGI